MADLAANGFFVPRGASTATSAIGADVAAKGLLGAYLDADAYAPHHVVYNGYHVGPQERARLQNSQPDRPLQFHDLADESGFPNLATIQCPGPLPVEDLAWRRFSAEASAATSLVGVCHTFSHAVAIDAVRRLVPAPCYEFDALVCPSQSLQRAVTQILEDDKRYYETEFGATNIRLPQTPVIPLGVTVERFAAPERDLVAARESLGIGPDEIAVLFVGRLDFATKAHPFAMLQGLAEAVSDTEQKVRLILAGWYPDAQSQTAFYELKSAVAPDLPVTELDGRASKSLDTAWQSADIFCSLVDNIQETFGLTPIEAKAAALPVVVTDWDGYRDSVRDGIDGFRIPTVGPGPEAGVELLRAYTETGDYTPYVAGTSQLVGVDLRALRTCFARLLADQELRRSMGAAGQADAQARFAWSTIMASYGDLWAALAEHRRASMGAGYRVPAGHRNLGRPYPFTLFQAYPTAWVAECRRVTAHPDLSRQTIESVLSLPLVRPYRDYFVNALDVAALGERISHAGEAAITDLLGSASEHDTVFMGLAWLYKHGLIQLDAAHA